MLFSQYPARTHYNSTPTREFTQLQLIQSVLGLTHQPSDKLGWETTATGAFKEANDPSDSGLPLDAMCTQAEKEKYGIRSVPFYNKFLKREE
ncbi:hypothetical protein PoB_001216100 [Plakobranchus ocellatus]|uniref:Uncharacterized protein n=1 Tax=Plakobranchus ocellatus TaxID=259542 RepID=A0AAV3YEA8_9GAST|nr:hypothetical protein PoB_001216100 [Plakobranchus ocellatus]